MVYKFFDKNTSGGGIKNENIWNNKLAEKLYKPIIGKFNKVKVYLTFIDNIRGTDFANMQLISNGIRFLLHVIDIYSKYTWVIYLKYKMMLQLSMLFKKR